jgi:hypothetical protein
MKQLFADKPLVDCTSDEVFRRVFWTSVPRGIAFAHHPTTASLRKKRRRAEYRLPPQIFSSAL